jgi:hypothetical protein
MECIAFRGTSATPPEELSANGSTVGVTHVTQWSLGGRCCCTNRPRVPRREGSGIRQVDDRVALVRREAEVGVSRANERAA